MAKNITLSLDEVVLRKARHAAVEADQSLSQWVTNLITREVSSSDASASAKERALKRLKQGFHLGGKPVVRETLHER